MTQGFEELGLRPELVAACEEAGYPHPTPLQSAAIPVLRRGGNAVLNASAGAGLVAAYGLALLDRLAVAAVTGGEGAGTAAAAENAGNAHAAEAAEDVKDVESTASVRALILVPTYEVAIGTTASLARFAYRLDLRATTLAPGWPAPDARTDAIVATPWAALRAVETSLLKLEDLRSFVLDDAPAILALDGREAVETLTGSVPRDAQRIVTAGEAGGAVDDYVERHVRRALRIPARAAAPAESAKPAGSSKYAVAAEDAKLDTMAALLLQREAGPAAIVHCRTAARAAALVDDLALRGIQARAEDEADGTVVLAGRGAPDRKGAWTISYDVPFDAKTLAARHADGGAILVRPRELPHLRRTAAEAGLTLEPAHADERPTLQDEVAAFRERLRRAVLEEDLGAQLLLLDPLLRDASAVELAAAASALLRRRGAATPPAPPAQAGPSTPSAPRTWVRLFIGIGQRDGIRPGDLVGAITGETGAHGKEVGRIEIRDTFSIVEVTSDVGERVIQALNGTTIKGRSVRVDYDRKTGAGR